MAPKDVAILENPRRYFFMGGDGSGRWGDHERKYTVEECLTLDLVELERQGTFNQTSEEVCGIITWIVTDQGGTLAAINFTLKRWDDEMELRLDYRMAEDDRPVTMWVNIQPVAHRNRGFRYYGTCPKCTRRVRKLYVPPGGERFLCRVCHKLTYESSQTAHEMEGAIKRAAEIMRRTQGG